MLALFTIEKLMDKKLRILFMGTPEFAVSSLEALFKSNYTIVGVVTAPDRPAGRGQQLRESAVKAYAMKQHLKILQPSNLKDPEFINELEELNANLQIVVAFRMLPEAVWKMPALGTFNLHASLLPNYRGAAPINWAIINGESESGLTTFYINENIDTGDIIMQERMNIGESETAGELHDRMMEKGSQLVLRTVQAIERNETSTINQSSLLDNSENKPAPKINKDTCKINWNDNIDSVYNMVRGLSPYPGAFTHLITPSGENIMLKIFQMEKEYNSESKPGSLITDGKNNISIEAVEGSLKLLEVQIAGKKRNSVVDFLRGFNIDNNWSAEQH